MIVHNLFTLKNVSRSSRVLTAVWLAIIFFLSTYQNPAAFEIGPPGFVGLFGHFAAYTVLALLISCVGVTMRHPRPSQLRVITITFIVSVSYGAAMEICQSIIPTRDSSILDLIVNAVGAVTGIALTPTLRWGIKMLIGV